MGTLGQLLLNLLITPPGSFIYHLVVIFSVTAAIQALLVNSQNNTTPRSRKMLTGLVILLAGQIILFLSSGLAWQNVFNPRAFLPPLDRAIVLLSLLWIGWLWCFPDPSRIANIITTLLTIVVGICFIITLVFWIGIYSSSPFNASWFDLGWTLFGLLTIVGGILILIVQKPQGYAVGLTILGINLLGYLIHFIWTPPIGDFSPAIRYANVISFPLMPLLSQRIQKVILVNKVESRHSLGDVINSSSMLTWLNLAANRSPEMIRSTLTKAVAEATGFNLCLLVSLIENENRVRIEAGFDCDIKQFFKPININTSRLPALVQTIQDGKIRSFLSQHKVQPDLNIISRALKIDPMLNMIVIPLPQEVQPKQALLLGTPGEATSLTINEQSSLTNLANAISPILEAPAIEIPGPAIAETAQADIRTSHPLSTLYQLDDKEFGTGNVSLSYPKHQLSNIHMVRAPANNTTGESETTNIMNDQKSALNNDDELEIADPSAVHQMHASMEQLLKENGELLEAIRKVQSENQELSSHLERLKLYEKENLDDIEDDKNPFSAVDEILESVRENSNTTKTTVEALFQENMSLETTPTLLSVDNADLKNLLASLTLQNQFISEFAENITRLQERSEFSSIDDQTINKVLSDMEAQVDEKSGDDIEDTDRILVKSRTGGEKTGEITQPINITSPNIAQKQGSGVVLPSEFQKKIKLAMLNDESLTNLGKKIASLQNDIVETGHAILTRQNKFDKTMAQELADIPMHTQEKIQNIGDLSNESQALNGISKTSDKPWVQEEQLRTTLQEVINANQQKQNELNNKLEEMNKLVESLNSENEKLRLELSKTHDTLNQTLEHQNKIDSELRMTLEEVARLEGLVANNEPKQATEEE